MTPHVNPAIILSVNPALSLSVARLYAKAVKAGEMDKRRQPPNGSECIVWIGEPHLPIAFATFYEPESRVGTLWLDVMYVVPAQRRKGLARLLILTVTEEARRLGYADLMLGTASTNQPMQSLAYEAGLSISDVIMKRTFS